MRRIIRKLVIVSVVTAVLAGLIYIITSKPAIVIGTELSLLEVDDVMPKSYEQDIVDRLDTGNMSGTLVYDGGTLPEEWEDGKFADIVVDITMRNITAFTMQNIEANILKPEEKSRIIWTSSDEVPQHLKPFAKRKVTVMWMDMYYGDMDYDEIEEYIRRQSVNVNYTLPIFGRQRMKVSLNDAEIVKVTVTDEDGNVINILDQ